MDQLPTTFKRSIAPPNTGFGRSDRAGVFIGRDDEQAPLDLMRQMEQEEAARFERKRQMREEKRATRRRSKAAVPTKQASDEQIPEPPKRSAPSAPACSQELADATSTALKSCACAEEDKAEESRQAAGGSPGQTPGPLGADAGTPPAESKAPGLDYQASDAAHPDFSVADMEKPTEETQHDQVEPQAAACEINEERGPAEPEECSDDASSASAAGSASGDADGNPDGAEEHGTARLLQSTEERLRMQIRTAYNKAEAARREMIALESQHERQILTLKRQLQGVRRKYNTLRAAASDPEKEAIRRIEEAQRTFMKQRQQAEERTARDLMRAHAAGAAAVAQARMLAAKRCAKVAKQAEQGAAESQADAEARLEAVREEWEDMLSAAKRAHEEDAAKWEDRALLLQEQHDAEVKALREQREEGVRRAHETAAAAVEAAKEQARVAREQAERQATAAEEQASAKVSEASLQAQRQLEAAEARAAAEVARVERQYAEAQAQMREEHRQAMQQAAEAKRASVYRARDSEAARAKAAVEQARKEGSTRLRAAVEAREQAERELEEQLEETRGRAQLAERALEEARGTWQQERNSLESGLKDSREEIARMQAELDHARAGSEAQSLREKELQEKIQGLRSSVEALKTEKSKLQGELEAASASLQEEKDAGAAADRERDESEGVLLARIDALEKQLQEANAGRDMERQRADAAVAAAAAREEGAKQAKDGQKLAEQDAGHARSQLLALGKRVEVLSGVLQEAKRRGELSRAMQDRASAGLLEAEKEAALAEARRLAAEAGELAGHRNPQQRIKYVQQLKQENHELRQQLVRLRARTKSASAAGKKRSGSRGAAPAGAGAGVGGGAPSVHKASAASQGSSFGSSIAGEGDNGGVDSVPVSQIAGSIGAALEGAEACVRESGAAPSSGASVVKRIRLKVKGGAKSGEVIGKGKVAGRESGASRGLRATQTNVRGRFAGRS